MTRLLRTVVSLLVLVVTTQGASATQDSPERVILGRAVAASRTAEPEWRFVSAIVNAPGPLMDEQLGVAAGTWWKSWDESTATHVTIYTIATAEAADRWLHRHAHGGAAKGWTVETYEFGDGATMATYPDPRGFTRYLDVDSKRTISGHSQRALQGNHRAVCEHLDRGNLKLTRPTSLGLNEPSTRRGPCRRWRARPGPASRRRADTCARRCACQAAARA